jgi:hypothetical protein
MKGTNGEARSTNLTVLSTQGPSADVAQLTNRAASLRRAAESQHQLVAQAYRRRAAELELQVWLTQLRAGHLVGPVAA